MKREYQGGDITCIDSLRGISALYVLLFHLPSFTFGLARSPHWLAPFVSGGGSAVLLFFIVSAFTLSRSLEERSKYEASPIVFYAIRRAFRIIPLFFTWLAIYLIRDPMIYGRLHTSQEIWSNITLTFNFIPRNEAGIVAGSWTIGVEMIFYALLPVLLRLAETLGKALALLAWSFIARMVWHHHAAIVIGEGEMAQQAYAMSFLLHLPTFITGIVVYRIIQAVGMQTLVQHGCGYALIAIAITLLGVILYCGPIGDTLDPYTILAFALAMLLLGACINPVGLIDNRVFRFYGRISFSVYLCHIPLILALRTLLTKIYEVGIPTDIAYFCALATVMIVVTTVALSTFYLIEMPGMALGRRFIGILKAAGSTQILQRSNA